MTTAGLQWAAPGEGGQEDAFGARGPLTRQGCLERKLPDSSASLGVPSPIPQLHPGQAESSGASSLSCSWATTWARNKNSLKVLTLVLYCIADLQGHGLPGEHQLCPQVGLGRGLERVGSGTDQG